MFNSAYDIISCKNRIKELRIEAERLEKLKDKMEDDGNYDDGIYAQIDKVYNDISYYERQIEILERMETEEGN